jgi:hypothetical protein
MPVGQKTTFEPVPNGTYYLRIEECTERAQKADASKTFFAWSFTVMNECEELGRNVRLLTPCTMNPGSTLEKMWLAAGQPELAVGADFNTDDIIGAEFYARVVIKNRKGNGGVFNDFETVWSVEGYEAEIAKATTRRPVAKQQPTQEPTEQEGTSQDEEQPAPSRPAAPAPVRPASPAPSQRKPLSFPQKSGAGSALKK